MIRNNRRLNYHEIFFDYRPTSSSQGKSAILRGVGWVSGTRFEGQLGLTQSIPRHSRKPSLVRPRIDALLELSTDEG
jgi:hypothetical protein